MLLASWRSLPHRFPAFSHSNVSSALQPVIQSVADVVLVATRMVSGAFLFINLAAALCWH